MNSKISIATFGTTTLTVFMATFCWSPVAGDPLPGNHQQNIQINIHNANPGFPVDANQEQQQSVEMDQPTPDHIAKGDNTHIINIINNLAKQPMGGAFAAEVSTTAQYQFGENTNPPQEMISMTIQPAAAAEVGGAGELYSQLKDSLTELAQMYHELGHLVKEKAYDISRWKDTQLDFKNANEAGDAMIKRSEELQRRVDHLEQTNGIH